MAALFALGDTLTRKAVSVPRWLKGGEVMAKSKWPDVQDKVQNGLVEAWARDGLTDIQIAHNLGISKDTFYTYKKEHSDFADALKRGKEVVDIEVENALLKRALGYEVEEVTYEDGKPVKCVVKQIAPDVTAQKMCIRDRSVECTMKSAECKVHSEE